MCCAAERVQCNCLAAAMRRAWRRLREGAPRRLWHNPAAAANLLLLLLFCPLTVPAPPRPPCPPRLPLCPFFVPLPFLMLCVMVDTDVENLLPKNIYGPNTASEQPWFQQGPLLSYPGCCTCVLRFVLKTGGPHNKDRMLGSCTMGCEGTWRSPSQWRRSTPTGLILNCAFSRPSLGCRSA